MAVRCEFIDFIIPISNIERVYPGGFKQFKKDKEQLFNGRLWHDNFLLRDGAMNDSDIEYLIKYWEEMDLQGVTEIGKEKKWIDFCIVESMLGGATLPCDWIEFDSIKRCVSFKAEQ